MEGIAIKLSRRRKVYIGVVVGMCVTAVGLTIAKKKVS